MRWQHCVAKIATSFIITTRPFFALIFESLPYIRIWRLYCTDCSLNVVEKHHQRLDSSRFRCKTRFGSGSFVVVLVFEETSSIVTKAQRFLTYYQFFEKGFIPSPETKNECTVIWRDVRPQKWLTFSSKREADLKLYFWSSNGPYEVARALFSRASLCDNLFKHRCFELWITFQPHIVSFTRSNLLYSYSKHPYTISSSVQISVHFSHIFGQVQATNIVEDQNWAFSPSWNVACTAEFSKRLIHFICISN